MVEVRDNPDNIKPDEPMRSQVVSLYQDATINIQFLKKQQWSIVNYTLLLYGAILYLYEKGILDTCWSRLSVLAVFIVCVFVLWRTEIAMLRFRRRVGYMYEYYFTQDEKEKLDLEGMAASPMRIQKYDMVFLLVGAALIGAVILFVATGTSAQSIAPP